MILKILNDIIKLTHKIRVLQSYCSFVQCPYNYFSVIKCIANDMEDQLTNCNCYILIRSLIIEPEDEPSAFAFPLTNEINIT